MQKIDGGSEEGSRPQQVKALYEGGGHPTRGAALFPLAAEKVWLLSAHTCTLR